MLRVALLSALTTFLCIPAPVEVGATPSPAGSPAGGITFVAVLKGQSLTTDDDKFPYTGTGSVTIDEATGTMNYSFDLSNGLTFAGTGTVAVSAKGRVYGISDTGSGMISGGVILEGKVDRNRTKFSAKMTAAIPNRLGPPPGGFVLSKIKVKGVRL